MSDQTVEHSDMDESPAEPLVHTIYASRAAQEFSQKDIETLLEKTRAANAKANITGMLLFSAGTFFQVLEGDPDVLEKLYEKIRRDPRHDQIKKLITEPIEERAFSDWTMGYVDASPEQLNEIEGMNDFFDSRTCLLDVDTGRAKQLLRAFGRGRWHIH